MTMHFGESCPGIKETSIIPLLLSSLSTTELCLLFFIQGDQSGQDIVYRSRNCSNKENNENVCAHCQKLFNYLNHFHHLQLKKSCEQYKFEIENVSEALEDTVNEIKTEYSPKKLSEETTENDPSLGEVTLHVSDTKEGRVVTTSELSESKSGIQSESIYNICEECGEIFEDQEQLINHSQNHRENINEQLSSTEYIEKQDVELIVEDIKIEEEQKDLEAVNSLNSEKKEEKFTCDYCGVLLLKRRKYNHIAYYHPDIISKRKEIFKEEKKRKKEEKSEQCPFCPKRVSKKLGSIYKHITVEHLNEKDNPTFQEIMNRRSENKHICSECGIGFETNQGYTHHYYKDHKNILKKDHLCTICGQGFVNSNALTTHTRNVHEDEKSLCVECNKMFPNRNSFRTHVKLSHSESNEVCSQCGNCFKSLFLLNRHVMRVHIGDKKHKCDECPKAFFDSHRLGRHKKEIHLNIRAYGCEKCSYKATTASNLNLHRSKMHQSKDHLTRLDLIKMIKNGDHPYCDSKFLELLHRSRDEKPIAYNVQ